MLDVGGSPIRLDPAAGPPVIGSDGTIAQGALRVATIGLFAIDPAARLDRGVDATVIPNVPAQPAVDQPMIGVRQGFVERSNVNPVTEMSRLILDQRMFEAVTQCAQGDRADETGCNTCPDRLAAQRGNAEFSGRSEISDPATSLLSVQMSRRVRQTQFHW